MRAKQLKTSLNNFNLETVFYTQWLLNRLIGQDYCYFHTGAFNNLKTVVGDELCELLLQVSLLASTPPPPPPPPLHVL